MRTKTLLLTAAAIAAGIFTASAQVYSVNVVGYVNVPVKGGSAFTLVANPLDDGVNTVTSLGGALPNKSQIQVWNGLTFDVASKTNGVWTANYSLPPGTGYFIKNGLAASPDITNTFVGSVIVGPGATNNSAIGLGFTLRGSPVPYTGNLNDAFTTTGNNIGATLANKSQIQVWDNSTTGQFIVSSKTNGVWTVNLPLGVGQGFFINAKAATNWVQSLP